MDVAGWSMADMRRGHTLVLLGIGWLIGLLVSLGFMFMGKFSTYGLEYSTERVTTSFQQSSETMYNTTTILHTYEVPFDVTASVTFISGIFVFAIGFVSIVYWRKIHYVQTLDDENHEPVCYTFVSVLVGWISGILFGIGLALMAELETQGKNATLGGAIIITLVVGCSILAFVMLDFYQRDRIANVGKLI